ncbi:T9SS type A sorting domain-containing protein [Bergeyella zoohelcum]|uniref:T9SS type A sorting domain-containing protein n=2 Tax=Bergeyella zoohelcum TaxID=1015 RepID=UPI003736EFA5
MMVSYFLNVLKPNWCYNNAPTGIAIHLPELSHEVLAFRKMSCVVAGFRPTATLTTKETPVAVSEFAVYPNPAKDFVQIKMPEHGKYSFIMVNTLGQIVLNAVETKIPIHHLEKGIYYLSIVKDNTEIIGTKKVIIE